VKHGATSVICAAVAATPGSAVSNTNSAASSATASSGASWQRLMAEQVVAEPLNWQVSSTKGQLQNNINLALQGFWGAASDQKL